MLSIISEIALFNRFFLCKRQCKYEILGILFAELMRKFKSMEIKLAFIAFIL